jgi:hypothetical protein
VLDGNGDRHPGTKTFFYCGAFFWRAVEPVTLIIERLKEPCVFIPFNSEAFGLYEDL